MKGKLVVAVLVACLVGALGVGAAAAKAPHAGKKKPGAPKPCQAGQAGGTCTRAWFPAYPSPKGCTQFIPLVQSTLGLSGLTVTRGLIQHTPAARREDLNCTFTPAGATDRSQDVVVDFLDRTMKPVDLQATYDAYMGGVAGCVASADADPSTQTPLAPMQTLGVGSQSFLLAPCASGWEAWKGGEVSPQYPDAWVRVGATRWELAAPAGTTPAALAALTRKLVAAYH